jgi:hypothetical protein
VATAERIFDQHHVFLMMSFMNKAQGVGWSNTPLYQHFRRKYPVDNPSPKHTSQSNKQVERLRELQGAHRGTLLSDTARTYGKIIEVGIRTGSCSESNCLEYDIKTIAREEHDCKVGGSTEEG